MSAMEKFENQKSHQIPTVTVRKNGSICINSYALEFYGIKECRSALLYYDPQESLIGIKLTKDNKDPTAFRVYRGNSKAVTVSARAFLKRLKIPYQEGSKIYRAGWDERKGMILVKLG